MKELRSVLPSHIVFILRVYLLGILYFFGFRLLLFILEFNRIRSIPDDRLPIVLNAFFMGWRFDTVISGYILIVPLLFLSIMAVSRFKSLWLLSLLQVYIGMLYTLAFLICTVDIPYFRFFFSRLTTSALTWLNTPGFVAKMIFQESSYWVFLIPLILILISFWVILSRIMKKLRHHTKSSSSIAVKRFAIGLSSLLLMGAMFIGIRGRLAEKSPIRVGTAFFSPYAFPNQLGLNPVFTFIRSALDDCKPENRRLNLMDERTALELASHFLHSQGLNAPDFPLARKIEGGPDSLPKQNVVIVIMESMSAEKMGRYGNPDHLTPFLDSLATHSLCFDNAYTAGIHTYNGIFSTLTGHPALLRQHSMNRLPLQNYPGIAETLKKKDYHTLFFMTHDSQFDNCAGFLSANGFDEVIAQDDYPSEKILSTLGVPDDYLFEYSISKINTTIQDNRPFLAVYMTASDHGPYIIPENIPFRPKSIDKRKAIVEYADWSCRKLIRMASEQAWYSNTLFVFIADHGYAGKGTYNMPIAYHHSPLIFFSPARKAMPGASSEPAGQIDICATTLGILNFAWVNNTLGIDLTRQKREFIFFSADDKIGCVNKEFFWIYGVDGKETLHQYKLESTINLISWHRNLADSMKKYSFSMMQSSQWMIANRKLNPKMGLSRKED